MGAGSRHIASNEMPPMSLKNLLYTATHSRDRRRHVRLRPKGDAYVRIDGRDYPLHDWSPDGLLIHPYRGGLIVNQKAKVEAVIRDIQAPDGMLRLNGIVLVTRIDDKGLAARWLMMPPNHKEKLLRYYARKPKA